MAVALVPRRSVSPLRQIVTPLLAFAIALLVAGAVLWGMGKSLKVALDVYIVEPLTSSWGLQEVILKATPLTLIAIGLIFAIRANRWNIGAEGQYVIGGMLAGAVAIFTHEKSGVWIMPALLAAGVIGGAAYAAIPAVLRNRFGISEILSSLMLVYVAELLLDFLVRGPWRDPRAFNFPKSVNFSDAATLGPIMEGLKLHWGVVFALLAVIVAAVLLSRSLFGFAVSATGEAPRAANFAGFNEKLLTIQVFAISGALAGLAGAVEVSANIGQLQPSIGQGYGFTAIIVAFLGRLNPVGALVAAFALSMLIIGSETAQVMLKLPFDMTRAFMGLLLLCVLAGEALTRFELKWRHG